MLQRAAIVREGQWLCCPAHEFGHCDGHDHARWWDQVRHFAAAATAEHDWAWRFGNTGPHVEMNE
ncbi:hypothetical protein ACFU93_32210 [Streptomyces sp. NPDC057611]|uniref:hypothetical protein n=1 Tax=Streptomyces sp. NPDC057611 TaxID=3346182 RepID=UPI0036953078